MDKNKVLLIYHNEDNDGVFSAGIFCDYLINKQHKDENDVELLGATYNDLNEITSNNEERKNSILNDYESVIMLDISFNDFSFIKALYKTYKNNFIWIDHHAQVIKETYRQNVDSIQGIRDTSRSTILNVYKYLYDQFDEKYNKKEIPELYLTLSAYDNYNWETYGLEFDYVYNINKGSNLKFNLNIGLVLEEVAKIRELDESDKNTDYLPEIQKLFYVGSIINTYESSMNEKLIDVYGDFDWKLVTKDKKEYKVCVLMNQGPTNSVMFKAAYEKYQCHLGAVLKHNTNSTWTMSLYSTHKDFCLDCGEFCKTKYKGGGHKGAAGCTISQSKFLTMLKNKTI